MNVARTSQYLFAAALWQQINVLFSAITKVTSFKVMCSNVNSNYSNRCQVKGWKSKELSVWGHYISAHFQAFQLYAGKKTS